MAYVSYSTALKNIVLQTGGHSYADALANGVLCLFGGTRPFNADATEGSAPLVWITKAGGAFTPGVSTNGINFTTASGGVLVKNPAETWTGNGLAAAGAGGVVATWARLYSNAMVMGGSGTNIDFDVATSGAYITLGNTLVVLGAPVTLSAASLTLP